MGTPQQRGQQAEQRARDYLVQRGLTYLNQNFRGPHGEIDLIFLDSTTLVIIEVRLRRSSSYASAAESITQRKQQRIINTTQYFLQTNPCYQHCNLRFDVVLFDTINQSPEWITAAFDASSA